MVSIKNSCSCTKSLGCLQGSVSATCLPRPSLPRHLRELPVPERSRGFLQWEEVQINTDAVTFLEQRHSVRGEAVIKACPAQENYELVLGSVRFHSKINTSLSTWKSKYEKVRM